MKIVNFQPQNTRVLAASATALKNQAVAYLSGKIYTFGGENSSGTVSASSFVFDIATNTWSSITALPASASGAQCWVSGSLIYIQGGKAASGSNPRTALYSYNPTTNAYTTLTAGTGAWSAACGVYTASSVTYLYAFGGYSNNNGTTTLTSIRRYNISTNAWATQTATVPTGAEADICSFTHSSKQYYIYNYVSAPTEISYYDYATDANYYYPTYEHNGTIVARNSAVVINNIAYMHGVSSISSTPSTELIDLNTNPTVGGQTLPLVRSINKFMFDCKINSLVTDGTKIYAVTGSNPNGTVETRVIEYTPHNQGTTWTLSSTTINDFSGGSDFASNGWTVVNGTQTNKWQVGTAGGTGTTGNSAYTSTDGGVTKGYNVNAASVVHFYRDVAVPSDGTAYDIQMFMNVSGEVGTGTIWDGVEVYSTSTSYTPTAGTRVNTGYRFYVTGSVTGGNYLFDVTYWRGTTIRFIISWFNDGSLGSGTGATIDTVKLNRRDLS